MPSEFAFIAWGKAKSSSAVFLEWVFSELLAGAGGGYFTPEYYM